MEKMRAVKKLILAMIFTFAVAIIGNAFVIKAEAADATIRFGSNYYEKNQNDLFPMGVYVQNSDGTYGGIGSYHLEISYDSTLLQYSSGATSFPNVGSLTLDGVGNADGSANKTMIYFSALAGGSANVRITGAVVYAADGTQMNVTSLGSVEVKISGTTPDPAQNDGNSTDANNDGQTDANQNGDGQNDGTNSNQTGNDVTEHDENKIDETEIDETDGDSEVTPEDNAEGGADIIADSTVEEGSDNAATGDATEAAQETGALETVDATSAGVNANTQDTYQSSGEGSTSASGFVRYLIIGIAAIVCVIICIVVIRMIIRVSSRNKKLNKMMKTGSDEQEWAFEFDTIDEDKSQENEWSYDSTVIDDNDDVDFDEVKNAENSAAYEAALNDSVNMFADEEDFLFEFDSIPNDDEQ